jgi:hypothetical protein
MVYCRFFWPLQTALFKHTLFILPIIRGLELILINGWASNVGTTCMSLHASMMQVCCNKLMMEESAIISSGGF